MSERYELQDFEDGEIHSLGTLHFAPFQPPTSRLLSMPLFLPHPTDTNIAVTTIPIIESLLSNYPEIPLNNTIVSLRSQQKLYTFRLVYRYSKLFLRNRALKAISRGVEWCGDMVVLKMGILDTYVNLNAGKDRAVALRAVRHFLEQAGPFIEQANLTNREVIEFPSNIDIV